jgi:hypothetical protein
MLTEEDDVKIYALAARGWSVSAISRHTGRDRKTVSKYLAAPRSVRAPTPSCLELYRAYIAARFEDDPHLEATVLHRELVDAGFGRAYTTLVGELRRLELRPVCLTCAHCRGDAVTTEIDHPAGEEIQWDWLELAAEDVPWGEAAYVLVGALSHSGRFRGVFCEQMTFGHLAAAMHQVLVARVAPRGCGAPIGMATIVTPQTGRITPDAAALAKHYGVAVAVCPARRAQHKGVVEKAIQYMTRSWWRTAASRHSATRSAAWTPGASGSPISARGPQGPSLRSPRPSCCGRCRRRLTRRRSLLSARHPGRRWSHLRATSTAFRPRTRAARSR